MSFGNILKKLRQDNKLTQDELAKKIETSRSNIANYENDKNMPSVDILEKISELFNVSIDYLLGKTDKNNTISFKEDEIYIALSKSDRGYISDEVKDKILEFAKFTIEQEKKKKNK